MADKTFLISPYDRQAVSYADFWRNVALTDLGDEEKDHSPPDFHDAFRFVTATLLQGSQATLVAQSLDPHEDFHRPFPRVSIPTAHTIAWSDPAAAPDIEQVKQGTARIRLLSSGTSGSSKAITHSASSLLQSAKVSDRRRNDVWGIAYHPAHYAGIQLFIQAFFNRNSIVRLFGYSPDLIHQAIEKYQVTHLGGTPTQMKLLCGQGSENRHEAVQRVAMGGESIGPRVMQDVRRVFPNAKVTNHYALTESFATFVSEGDVFQVNEIDEHRVRIIDGQLALHQDLLAESVVSQTESEFYLTGDRVEIVGENPLRFRVLGRTTEVVNVGGYNVFPTEIEQLLLTITGVQAAKVYGVRNSVTGNILGCDLVHEPASPELTVRGVREFLENRLPKYKVPRIIKIVSELQQTASGKIARSQ